MKFRPSHSAVALGGLLCLGLVFLGAFVNQASVRMKDQDRGVTVKGLSEREYPADVVIWPIQFLVVSNDIDELYDQLEEDSSKVMQFLAARGVSTEEITRATPEIVDRSAQRYSNNGPAPYRFSAVQTLTLYSKKVDEVRGLMSDMTLLGKQGIVFGNGDYQAQPEYVFTKLNQIKPDMIEEATRQAREVAQKFAEDSESELGKIRRASQGQFSIEQRDTSTPHIKRVRVVSTVEYYLVD